MLYLVDRPLADVAFRTAADDPDARVVLIQDGVLLDPDSDAYPDLEAPTYAVAKDAAVRGVDLPDGVEPVEYDAVLDLILDHEVKSFV